METHHSLVEIEYKPELDAPKTICRCCLSTDRRVVKIENYRELFVELADIIVSDSDGLPQWLCWECSCLLMKSVRFKQKVLKAHLTLYNYHSRCAPFPIDGQDPELTKYANPQLSSSATLVIDNVKTKTGYHKVLEHEKIHFMPPSDETHFLDEEVPLKLETEDDVPLQEIRENKLKDMGLDGFITESTQEKKEKTKKVKKKVKIRVTDNIKTENELESEPQEAKTPKKRNLRRTIDIDENKIRVITLDPAEQLRQRQAENEATLKFPFQCHLCFKGFNYEEKLKNHMFKHSPARGSYKCEVCSMYLPTPYSASVHGLTHTLRYECVQCGRRMTDRLAIVNHYRSQHEGVLSVYTCHICGKVSNNDKTHRGHMRNHHSGSRAVCRECGKSFVNNDSLAEHMLIHQGIKNYECPECGKRFRTRNQIRHHLVKHSDHKDFYCVECDVRFKSAHTLRQHLKRTTKHKDKKSLKFACSLCPKRFDTAALLTTHTRVQHEGSRPHRCEECGASLATRASLHKHARSVHRGLRPPPSHICHACGKLFRARSTLVNHVRTHTGEKPYPCEDCGRRFAQRTAMRTHVKLVHMKHRGRED
ncbi:unnamed protein product [Danaus chrysippus]|uniref:(African queen) hypothetical protein n=1 Tax=Danaus chrysippus TaxID=151541 RepID=A0A8J2R1G0_9NEOP|nr:unnamed protein product [Danaus chrysippus]